MTHHDTLATPTRTSGRIADRRVLVGLAALFLAGFVVLMASSTDREPDADPAKIISSNTTSLGTAQVQSFALMALCGVLVFLGVGIRSRLVRRGPVWTADVSLVGFALLAMGFAGFGLSGLMMAHAIDIGDPTVVAATNLLDTENFLPLMAAFICTYVGIGATGLITGALPRWLGWASVVLGVAAPFGPAGFAPFMLLPVWLLVVAWCLRTDDGPA
jgi:hypothetical protein